MSYNIERSLFIGEAVLSSEDAALLRSILRQIEISRVILKNNQLTRLFISGAGSGHFFDAITDVIRRNNGAFDGVVTWEDGETEIYRIENGTISTQPISLEWVIKMIKENRNGQPR